MFKARCVVLLMFGSLLSSVCFADESVADYADELAAAELTISTTTTDPELWLERMETLGFQDNSPLGRVSRIRDLPLLTFSETRSTRFFLGVNSDGFVGLHFKSK